MTLATVITSLENAKAKLEKQMDQIAGYPIYRNDTYAWSLIDRARNVDELLAEARKMQEKGEEI